MKIKEVNFSEYTYKRICIYEENQTFYPAGLENVLLESHGEKELASAPDTDNFGWLILVVGNPVAN